MLKFRRTILKASAGLLVAGPMFGHRQALAQTPACDDNPTPVKLKARFTHRKHPGAASWWMV